MNKFKIIPLSAAYAARIRETKKDDFGHEVIEQVAKGKGPCRVSLKPFEVGKDMRLLFSHSPFPIDNAFNQPGPIFINKETVEPYDDIYRFPPEIKADKINFPLSLIGYSQSQKMVFTKVMMVDLSGSWLIVIRARSQIVRFITRKSMWIQKMKIAFMIFTQQLLSVKMAENRFQQ